MRFASHLPCRNGPFLSLGFKTRSPNENHSDLALWGRSWDAVGCCHPRTKFGCKMHGLLHFVPRCPLGLILSATTRGKSPTLPRLCFKPHCSHPAAWLGSLPPPRIPETDTPLKTCQFPIKFRCKLQGLLRFVTRCPSGLILSLTARG